MKKAIDLWMEILQRVPNLSFVLQGEDTINLKTLLLFLLAYIHVDVVDADVVVVAADANVVVAVADGVANAIDDTVGVDVNANTDAYDACSDANVSA